MASAESTPWASAADADFVDPFALDPRFRLWLAVQPNRRTGRRLAVRTIDRYCQRVALYLEWLRDSPFRDALTTPHGRDTAVQAYRQQILATRRSTTWNVTLAAVTAYYVWLELGPAQVRAARIDDRRIQRTLAVDEQSALIATAERRPAHTPLMRARRARNLALVMVLLYGGLRESEAEALDIADMVLTGRRSFLWAPAPGGDELRRIELARRAHTAQAEWQVERADMLGPARIQAYFLVCENGPERTRRLSVGQIEDIIEDLGRDAGLPERLAPGVLRATYAAQLLAAEPDLPRVAYTLGQVKPDMPQVNALRANAPTPHPGRLETAGLAEDGQLALDF
ncbi:tyrosine-type recombinase/integrase [Nocardia sp. NPDC004722]